MNERCENASASACRSSVGRPGGAGFAGASCRGAAIANDNGRISSRMPAKITSVVLPADIVDQADRERREQELAERARRGAGAEDDRSPALGGNSLANARDDQVNEQPASPKPISTPDRQVELMRRDANAIDEDADRIKQRADDDHPDAPKRSAIAPENGCTRPYSSIWIASASAKTSRPQPCRVVIGAQEKAEGRARPEADHADQAAAGEDDGGVRQLAATGNRRLGGIRRSARSSACRIRLRPGRAAPPASRRSAG